MEKTALPVTRDITCLHCGHCGLLDIHDDSGEVAPGSLFRHLGHNPFSGDLHYRCPACNIVLLVDPMLALGKTAIRGIPQLRTGGDARREEGAIQSFINGLLARRLPEESSKRRLS